MSYPDNADGLLSAINDVKGVLDYGKPDTVRAVVMLCTSDDSVPCFASYHATPDSLRRMIYQLLHHCLGINADTARAVAMHAGDTINADHGALADQISSQLLRREIARITGTEAPDHYEEETDYPGDSVGEGA